jgi:glycosyltransferase involved in cell wall biosynthesis
MWLIEALKPHCEIAVLTTGGWDLSVLNSYYGTQVRSDEVRVRIAPVPFPFRQLDSAALRGACYQRFAREVANEYDLRISAYNFTDWGMPAIHFIADFSWHPQLRDQLDSHAPGFIYQDTLARKAYLKFVQALHRPSRRDLLREDTILANSLWSAALVKDRCGVNCAAVVYPPVWDEFPEVPCQEKEPAFAMIGRVTPEKRIDRAIAILEAIRQLGHDIRLHLCGEIKDDYYGSKIAKLCNMHADWIITHGLVSGHAKQQILANCSFGIQARDAEPFGIAVAEMVKSGAIVFAPNNGGQAEIINCQALLFSDVPDAVNKICAVLENKAMQAELRTHLSLQAKLFNAKVFMQTSREIIFRFAQSGGELGSTEQEGDDSPGYENKVLETRQAAKNHAVSPRI